MLDWPLYRDSYSTEAMRRIWSEASTIKTWIEVEQALAKYQAELGLIPKAAATAIGRISAGDLDHDALCREMNLVGRPIVGLVRQLRALAGPKHAQHVHFRSTTQDVMDTALAMQMKRSLDDIEAATRTVIGLLDDLCKRHACKTMIGRTNGQYAMPMMVTTKLSVWRAELARRQEAIGQARIRGLLVQVGGPVGDLSAYEDGVGDTLKGKMAEGLGLGTAEPHWQNARDGVVDIITALGSLCATLCKICHNVNLLASSDIAEMHEGYREGKGASSSMAHKKNQRASEFGEAVARLGRQRAEQIGELTLHEHERSGGVWLAEWIVVPEVFLLTSGALAWNEHLFQGLHIDGEAMARHVESYKEDLTEQ